MTFPKTFSLTCLEHRSSSHLVLSRRVHPIYDFAELRQLAYQVLNNIVTFWPSSAMVGPWETQQEFGEIFRHWSSDAYSGLGCCSREFLRRKWPAGWECIGSQ